MEPLYRVPAADGIAMWAADMDFRSPPCALNALQAVRDHGVLGYYGDDAEYRAAIQWWMQKRHGWNIAPEWILTTNGLVNGFGLCLDAFTDPGDGILLFTPVYHVFARVVRAADRRVVECPLVKVHGRFEFDFARYEAQMSGSEKVLVLCSPHNPGGRVWSRSELEELAAFAKRHDLLIVSDEIHHDLLMPGQTHIPMANIADDISDRLIMMTSAAKTFNIAGLHTGNVIIPDDSLRSRFANRITALGISPNLTGMHVTRACFSPEGEVWLEQLLPYLNDNRAMFEDGLNRIPGVSVMPLESTFLVWVDFSGTGLSADDIGSRIRTRARIAANQGEAFGTGGEGCIRFNIATPRARLTEVVTRIQDAFADPG
jgi:cystathionine beta-lyase